VDIISQSGAKPVGRRAQPNTGFSWPGAPDVLLSAFLRLGVNIEDIDGLSFPLRSTEAPVGEKQGWRGGNAAGAAVCVGPARTICAFLARYPPRKLLEEALEPHAARFGATGAAHVFFAVVRGT